MQFRESLCHFFPFYDIPPQHCCCTWNTLLPAGMFSARVQKHQASNQTLILMQIPEKSFFQLSFLLSLPGLYGWDRDMERTHYGTNIPVGLLHHCTSAQHMDNLSFKGRFNPGISQAFEHLLPRLQPKSPVHPV